MTCASFRFRRPSNHAFDPVMSINFPSSKGWKSSCLLLGSRSIISIALRYAARVFLLSVPLEAQAKAACSRRMP